MKLNSIIMAASAIAVLGAAPAAHAADNILVYSVEEFMAKSENSSMLEGFTFQWGANPTGSVITSLNTSRPANGRKPPQIACERALLNSLLALRDATLAQGGSKVTGIHSTHPLVKDPSKEYVCIKGGFVAKTPLIASAAK